MRALYFKSTFVIILLLLIGCSALGSESQGEPREQAMTIVLSQDKDVLPIVECGRKEVATQLALFFDAFNRGDEEVMAQFFDDNHFDFFGGKPLYAEPDADPIIIESMNLLVPEFMAWHQKGERMYLESIQIFYSPHRKPEILDMNYVLARQNLNSSPEIKYYWAKGLLFCDSAGVRLIKSSSGTPVFGIGNSGNCPLPDDSDSVLIVCGQPI